MHPPTAKPPPIYPPQELNSPQPPAPSGSSLAIWWSFKVYCLAMILFLGATLTLGAIMVASPETLLKGDSTYQQHPKEAKGAMALVGLILVVISAPPLVPMLPALVWPRGRVGWWLGLAAIIAGTFTMGGWLFSIPLAILWGKHQFRRSCGLQ